jgi:hypothetical protein
MGSSSNGPLHEVGGHFLFQGAFYLVQIVTSKNSNLSDKLPAWGIFEGPLTNSKWNTGHPFQVLGVRYPLHYRTPVVKGRGRETWRTEAGRPVRAGRSCNIRGGSPADRGAEGASQARPRASRPLRPIGTEADTRGSGPEPARPPRAARAFPTAAPDSLTSPVHYREGGRLGTGKTGTDTQDLALESLSFSLVPARFAQGGRLDAVRPVTVRLR